MSKKGSGSCSQEEIKEFLPKIAPSKFKKVSEHLSENNSNSSASEKGEPIKSNQKWPQLQINS